jgi:5'-3' exonuclease
MGIPRFFANIIKKHTQSLIKTVPNGVDYLFIDFNSMVYDTLKCMSTTKLTNNFEKNLIKETINYLEFIIDLTSPKLCTYICIDGVPPVAKMKQQRSRRFRSIMYENYKSILNKEYGIPQEKSWSTNSISPGTIFMNELSKSLKLHYKSKKNVIISDHNIPGEGEHKILNLIKDPSIEQGNGSIVIYSPDADLIVLCLTTVKNNIYLLRNVENEISPEETAVSVQGPQRGEYVYLDIDFCRNIFSKETGDLLDYSFLTFLCGNDFVVSSIFLKMKDNGLDLLISLYNKIKESSKGSDLVVEGLVSPVGSSTDKGLDNKSDNKSAKVPVEKLDGIVEESVEGLDNGPVIVGRHEKRPVQEPFDFKLVNSDHTINFDSFKRLIFELKEIEVSQLMFQQRKMHRIRNNALEEIPPGIEGYEKKLKNFQHMEYFNPNHPFYSSFNKVFNAINFYDDKWNSMYNSFFFKEDLKDLKTRVNGSVMDDDICLEYIKSLNFCLRYYYSKDIDWEWYYPYRAAPTFHDLYDFLCKDQDIQKKISIIIDSKPLEQHEQLLIILPKHSLFLLPQKLRTLDSFKKKKYGSFYYPNRYQLDIVQGQKYIYSEPILPRIDISLVKEYFKYSKNDTKQNPKNNSKQDPKNNSKKDPKIKIHTKQS